MKNLHLPAIEQCRDCGPIVFELYGSTGDHENGVFRVPSPIDQQIMNIIASTSRTWEHVSISRRNRCPNWPEMSYIHRMFFKDDEPAMQLHVAGKDHINVVEYCLHLWRPTIETIPGVPAMTGKIEFIHGVKSPSQVLARALDEIDDITECIVITNGPDGSEVIISEMRIERLVFMERMLSMEVWDMMTEIRSGLPGKEDTPS